MEENEMSFTKKIKESIIGPPKKRVTITFPEEVFNVLDKYSKEYSADCYWLSIKQLLDFFVEQKDGDLKSVMIMQHISEMKGKVEEMDERIYNLEHPKDEKKSFQTFGKNEVKKDEKS